jgi:hypothetical protein
LVTIALAILALAAAPPPSESSARRSPWRVIVERTKAMAHDPFGRKRDDRRPPEAAVVGKPGRAAQGEGTASRPTARSPFPTEPTAPQVKRSSWLSRAKSRPRTVSEFMAQQKP